MVENGMTRDKAVDRCGSGRQIVYGFFRHIRVFGLDGCISLDSIPFDGMWLCGLAGDDDPRRGITDDELGDVDCFEILFLGATPVFAGVMAVEGPSVIGNVPALIQDALIPRHDGQIVNRRQRRPALHQRIRLGPLWIREIRFQLLSRGVGHVEPVHVGRMTGGRSWLDKDVAHATAEEA